jgi:hypothetical protein
MRELEPLPFDWDCARAGSHFNVRELYVNIQTGDRYRVRRQDLSKYEHPYPEHLGLATLWEMVTTHGAPCYFCRKTKSQRRREAWQRDYELDFESDASSVGDMGYQELFAEAVAWKAGRDKLDAIMLSVPWLSVLASEEDLLRVAVIEECVGVMPAELFTKVLPFAGRCLVWKDLRGLCERHAAVERFRAYPHLRAAEDDYGRALSSVVEQVAFVGRLIHREELSVFDEWTVNFTGREIRMIGDMHHFMDRKNYSPGERQTMRTAVINWCLDQEEKLERELASLASQMTIVDESVVDEVEDDIREFLREYHSGAIRAAVEYELDTREGFFDVEVSDDEDEVEIITATPKRRRIRGGRRVRMQKMLREPGYCYQGLYSRKDRVEAMSSLGPAPQAQVLADAPYRPSGLKKALVLNRRGYHVQVRPDWDQQGQLRYLSDKRVTARVGATEYEFAERLLIEEYDVLFDDPAIQAGCLAGDFDEPKEMQECLVGGEGYCWQLLPITNTGESKMTVDKVISGLEECDSDFQDLEAFRIKWSRQDDGDFHIDDVENAAAPKIRGVAIDSYTECWTEDAYVDGWQKMRPFLELLRVNRMKVVGDLNDSGLGKMEEPVLVGKAQDAPIDAALMSLTSPEIQRTAQNLRVPQVTAEHLQVESICPWSIPIDNQHHANELKLPWSKTSALSHPHPIHGGTRRWMLKIALPKYINTDCTVFSMGPGNLAMLDEAVNGGAGYDTVTNPRYHLKVVNPILDLKDLGRYGGTPNHIPTEVFGIRSVKVETPTAFFMDSGHYIREGGLLKLFIENPKLHTVVMSMVYPVDAMVTNTSTRPTLYQWTVSGDTMVYIPEGDVGGRYEQPADPGLLMLNEVESIGGRWAVYGGIVESKLNTHVMVWTRFKVSTFKYLPLLLPTMMNIPRVMRSAKHCKGMIRVDDYLRLVEYLKTLLKGTERDIWAKLRLMVDAQAPWLPLSEKEHLVQAVELVAKQRLAPELQSKFYTSLAEEVYYKTIGHVIRVKHKMFNHRYSRRIAKIVDNPDPVRIFPLAKAKVHWKNSDMYELQWQFPKMSQEWVFATIAHWARSMLGVPNVKPEDYYSLAEDGTLVMDRLISPTARNIKAHGVDLVFASQATAFWTSYDPERLSRQIPNEVEGPEPRPPIDEDARMYGKTDRIAEKMMRSETSLPSYQSQETLPLYSKVMPSTVSHSGYNSDRISLEQQQVRSLLQSDSSRASVSTMSTRAVTEWLNPREFVEKELLDEAPDVVESVCEWNSGQDGPERLPPLDDSLDSDGVAKWKRAIDIRKRVMPGTAKKCEHCGLQLRRVCLRGFLGAFEPEMCHHDCCACHESHCQALKVGVAQNGKTKDQADDHCEICPRWEEWRLTHIDSYDAYCNFCDQRHVVMSLPTGPVREYWDAVNENSSGVAQPKKTNDGTVLAMLDALLEESQYRPRGGPRKQEMFNALVAPPRPKQEPWEKQLQKQKEEQDLMRVKLPVDDETKEERMERLKGAWDKMRKHMPHSGSTVHNYRGKVLWDVLFRLSVDRRVKNEPFKDVEVYRWREYPENDCMLSALAQMVGESEVDVFVDILRAFPKNAMRQQSLPLDCLHTFGCQRNLCIEVVLNSQKVYGVYGIARKATQNVIRLKYEDGHLSATRFRPALTIMQNPIPYDMTMPDGFKRMMREIDKIPYISWKPWTPEGSRGALYVRCMIDKTTGMIGMNPLNEPKLKSWEASCDIVSELPSNRRIAVVEGDPGCRKSSPLQKLLSNKAYQRNNLFTMIAATNNLAGDWKNKIGVMTKDPKTKKGAPSSTIVTFEKALTDGYWGYLVVTDEDKYTKGYHALYATLNPQVTNMLVLGDRYQSKKHEVNEDCKLNENEIASNMEFYSQYSDHYLRGTWRFGPKIANFFRMPTFVEDPSDYGGFYFSDTGFATWIELKLVFPNMSDDKLKKLFEERHVYAVSHDKARVVGSVAQFDVITFAGSQGMGTDLAIVILDEMAINFADPRIWYTVLTRAKAVIIWSQYRPNQKTEQAIQANPILRELLWYKGSVPINKPAVIHPSHTISMQDLCGKLTCRSVLHGRPENVRNAEFVAPFMDFNWREEWIDPDVSNGAKVGLARLNRESPEYAEEPQFAVNIEEWQHYRPQEMAERAERVQAVKLQTHVAPVMIEHLDERHNAQMLERFDAELTWKNMFSSQKPDNYMFRRDQYDVARRLKKQKWPNLPRRQQQRKLEEWLETLDEPDHPLKFHPGFLNWGQYQRSSDWPSFAAGIAQRMRFATRDDNAKEYEAHKNYGLALWSAMCRYLGWDSLERKPLNQAQFDDAIIVFQERRQARTVALKKASLNRAEPDFGTALTAKNQWKMKDVDFPVAKALQPILIKSDEYLFRFGPIGVYLLDCLLRDTPPYMYWHAKKTIDEQIAWSAQYDDHEDFEELDIEGFDGSVRGEGVVLIEMLMRRYGIPEADIQAYIDDKLDFHTRVLFIALMTMSGECFTWLGNSVKSIARECLKYNIMPGWPMQGSGDDIKRKAGLAENPQFLLEWGPVDFAKEKRKRTSVGEFCSVKSKNGVSYKDPIVLYKRLRGQLSMGNLDNIALGYFDLFAMNYRLGDRAYEVMDDVEMEHASAINYIMFNIRKFGYKSSLPWDKIDVTNFDKPDYTSPEINSVLKELSTIFEQGLESFTTQIMDPYTGYSVEYEY